MLGADHVIASRLADRRRQVHRRDRLLRLRPRRRPSAIAALAEERGYDLADCFAYSDSITDAADARGRRPPRMPSTPTARLRKAGRRAGWPVVDFARPVAMPTMRQRLAVVNTKDNRRTALRVGAATVALGIAWYASRRRSAG